MQRLPLTIQAEQAEGGRGPRVICAACGYGPVARSTWDKRHCQLVRHAPGCALTQQRIRQNEQAAHRLLKRPRQGDAAGHGDGPAEAGDGGHAGGEASGSDPRQSSTGPVSRTTDDQPFSVEGGHDDGMQASQSAEQGSAASGGQLEGDVEQAGGPAGDGTDDGVGRGARVRGLGGAARRRKTRAAAGYGPRGQAASQLEDLEPANEDAEEDQVDEGEEEGGIEQPEEDLALDGEHEEDQVPERGEPGEEEGLQAANGSEEELGEEGWADGEPGWGDGSSEEDNDGEDQGNRMRIGSAAWRFDRKGFRLFQKSSAPSPLTAMQAAFPHDGMATAKQAQDQLHRGALPHACRGAPSRGELLSPITISCSSADRVPVLAACMRAVQCCVGIALHMGCAVARSRCLHPWRRARELEDIEVHLCEQGCYAFPRVLGCARI